MPSSGTDDDDSRAEPSIRATSWDRSLPLRAPQALPQPLGAEQQPPLGHGAEAAELHQPVGEARVAGVLDVGADGRGPQRVDLVGQPHRRGDHRAGATRAPAAVRSRVHHEAEQVAVAARTSSRGSRLRPGSADAVAQQQERAAEGAGRQHHRSRRSVQRLGAGASVGVGALVGRLVDDVAHDRSHRRSRRDPAHLAAGADVRAGVRGLRQVVVVEGVLGAVVAADVALAAEPARASRQPEEVAVGPSAIGSPGTGGRGRRGTAPRAAASCQSRPSGAAASRSAAVLRVIVAGSSNGRLGAEHRLGRSRSTGRDRPGSRGHCS